MNRQIDGDIGILDLRWKHTHPARHDRHHPTDLATLEQFLDLEHGRIESLDMPHHQLQSLRLGIFL